MSGACSTSGGRREMHIVTWLANLREIYIGVDGNTILNGSSRSRMEA
jgi:hypothetical protein